MLGLKVIGQGATTKIYRDGNTAVKLYVNAPPNEAEDEAERQRFAIDAGLPVPAVIGVRRLDDCHTALDMEYVDGKPFMEPGMDKDERMSAIQTLVKLQCEIHRVTAYGQPNQAKRFTWNIKRTDYLNGREKDRLLVLLNKLDTGAENLCHGDIHPRNILYDGRKHWVIDWVNATAGSPLADACRTYLIFKQFMTRSAGIYLRLFCKEAGVKPEDVLEWLPVVAAARLNENVVDEKVRSVLLEMVKQNIKE